MAVSKRLSLTSIFSLTSSELAEMKQEGEGLSSQQEHTLLVTKKRVAREDIPRMVNYVNHSKPFNSLYYIYNIYTFILLLHTSLVFTKPFISSTHNILFFLFGKLMAILIFYNCYSIFAKFKFVPSTKPTTASQFHFKKACSLFYSQLRTKYMIL